MVNLPRFGVENPVIANLVTFSLIVAGVIFGVTLRREFLPPIDPTFVIVNAPYPGAAPDEVEDALVIKIEDRLVDIDGVKEVTSTVAEGGAGVVLEFEEGTDINQAVADVKREIDALQDLPDEADRITVLKLEPRLPVIIVTVFGDVEERTLKEVVRQVDDDLRSLPGIGDTVVGGTRRDEIVVEVIPEALLEYGLSLPDVADRIRSSMLELPGGSVRSPTQTVGVRAVGVEERADAVRAIVVKAAGDGRVVRLDDVADVSTGFADVDYRFRFNGRPTVSVTVFKKGKQDIVKMAEIVKAYVKGRRGEPLKLTFGEQLARFFSPPGSDQPPSDRVRAYELGLERGPVPGQIQTTTDLARFVSGRLDLLIRNGTSGGIFVFLTLVLLLNWRVSIWVTSGLIVAVFGTLVVMRVFDITLNLMTMFGLIIVVGILVDDGIVIAENITALHEKGVPPREAAVKGAGEVAWPVVGTVLTTIFAFLPLALIQGQIGDFMEALPIVVTCALSVSLLEALIILPCHMAYSLRGNDARRQTGATHFFGRIEDRYDKVRDGLFSRIIIPGYARLLRVTLRFRYISLCLCLAAIVISLSMLAGGRLEFIFFETDDSETVDIQLRMPVGTPVEETDRYIRILEQAASAQPEVLTVFAQTGVIGDLSGEGGGANAGNVGQLVLELLPVEERTAKDLRNSDDVMLAIRQQAGPLPGIKSLRMEGVSGGPGGSALSFTLTSSNNEQIDQAVKSLMHRLGEFVGVYDLATDVDSGQRELRFTLRESARELGFTRASLGRQIQAAVFGIEAFTFAGIREDVDVRVMMPEHVRRSQDAIESMYVFTPDGRPVPIGEVAQIEDAEAYVSINRLDRQRAVTLTADVDRSTGANPESITASIQPFLRSLERENPGLRILQRGRQKQVAESMATLPLGMLVAFALIYVCLAWLFKSYTQPLIVMAAIPFSIVGVVWGHLILGYSMTFLSLIGFVALAGVVVNDSIIYMEFFNTERRSGMPAAAAAIAAGRARIRAILLTTITTVLGLLPLILEKSLQARFLIPMAITIAVGLISATALVLLVLPSMLLMLDDFRRVTKAAWTGHWEEAHDPLTVKLVTIETTSEHDSADDEVNGHVCQTRRPDPAERA
ncbi:MAG: efflux RND transporter permease subunit [Leptolyngbya sp. PLA3]|nr:MAG: efflux RND transporter permease subunit [Cyanobacteria bacterium CYA]MCE7967844.1 efflux RND transporter permease subunit [Leptolyngbya sp. PL-A3]